MSTQNASSAIFAEISGPHEGPGSNLPLLAPFTGLGSMTSAQRNFQGPNTGLFTGPMMLHCGQTVPFTVFLGCARLSPADRNWDAMRMRLESRAEVGGLATKGIFIQLSGQQLIWTVSPTAGAMTGMAAKRVLEDAVRSELPVADNSQVIAFLSTSPKTPYSSYANNWMQTPSMPWNGGDMSGLGLIGPPDLWTRFRRGLRKLVGIDGPDWRARGGAISPTDMRGLGENGFGPLRGFNIDTRRSVPNWQWMLLQAATARRRRVRTISPFPGQASVTFRPDLDEASVTRMVADLQSRGVVIAGAIYGGTGGLGGFGDIFSDIAQGATSVSADLLCSPVFQAAAANDIARRYGEDHARTFRAAFRQATAYCSPGAVNRMNAARDAEEQRNAWLLGGGAVAVGLLLLGVFYFTSKKGNGRRRAKRNGRIVGPDWRSGRGRQRNGTKLPRWSDKSGWVGGDSRTLYAFTDKLIGKVTVRPGNKSQMRGIGPNCTVRVATREEAQRLWGGGNDGQGPLHSGWKVS